MWLTQLQLSWTFAIKAGIVHWDQTVVFVCWFIFSFYGNDNDAVMLWAYVCSCVAACPPFSSNSWPFSAQFHVKLVGLLYFKQIDS